MYLILNKSFILFNISSKLFFLYLEYYLLSSKMHKNVSKQIYENKKHINITKKSVTSITVIYHSVTSQKVLKNFLLKQFCLCFYNFPIRFQNCSNSVVLFCFLILLAYTLMIHTSFGSRTFFQNSKIVNRNNNNKNNQDT